MSGRRKNRKGAVSRELRDRALHDQGIWMDAVEEVRRGLSAHCRDSKTDKLRFQDGRLEFALWGRIKAVAGEDQKKRIVCLFRCYRVMTIYPLGYDEPLRLHVEEMRAAGLQKSPRIFCRLFARGFASRSQATVDASREELVARFESITSWMEAREAFSQWLASKEDRAYWRGGPSERRRAFQARILASWKSYLGMYEYEHNGRVERGMRLWEGLGIGTNEAGVPWNPRHWANILRRAAKIAEKGSEDCTPLEEWVWWCYPVFSRYAWSAREVQDAARARFAGKDLRNFGRYWMSRGLRFFGRKTNRKDPPLFEFVRDIAVPSLKAVRGVVIFPPQRFPTKKS